MKPLKPVMAALLAASSAMFALPGISRANDLAADRAADSKAAAGIQKTLLDVTAKEVATDPAGRKNIGTRLTAFVESKDEKGAYLYLLVRDTVDEKLLTGLAPVVQKWVDTVAGQGRPGDVAVLDLVVTDGDKPVAAPANGPAPEPTLTARLQTALAGQGWTDAKRIVPTDIDGIDAFLEVASSQSWIVLQDTRTKPEVQTSVGQNDTTGVRPPTVGNATNPLDGSGSGFGFDDLYRKGAEVANVYSPGDKGYRTLSMKVYTTKDDNGNPINRVGIVDITANDITSPSMPQFIDASTPGDTDIVMRDGGRHYTATVGADGSVTLRRAGTKDGEGGEITTSKAQLSADRDAQIRGSGTVLIGGQPYYVLGQGGEKGSFLFFSEAGMQAAPNGNAHPDLMGDVAHVVGDGSTAPITGKPDLGQLQDGSPWHLEFNMVSRLWEVKPGIGDQPKKKKDGTGDPTGGSTPPATSTSTDANGDANNPAPADPTAGAPTTLDQAIALAEQDKADKSQVWTEDSSNAGFDAATKSQLRIMSNVQSGMKHFNVLFDPSLGVHDNHFEFQTISQNIRLLRIRGVGKYVAMEYATNSQYYDLKNFANYVQHVYDSSLSYSEAGSYSTSNGMMQNVTDQDIMVDILVHRLKVKANDPMIATLRARVAKNVPKDSGYVINGDTTTVYLGYGEVGMTIWPNEVLAGDKDSNAGLTGLRGPGTAVSVTGGEAGDFKTEMDMGSGRTATLVKKANGAALYAGAEDENDKGVIKTSKVWYVMIQYKKNKLDSRSKPLPVFGGLGRFPMPAGVSLQGLPSSDLPDTTQLMMEYGSTQEDGAIAAYRTTLPDAQGGSNVRDKAGNCAGPVLWWGRVTEQQAQNACASDSKIR